MEEESTQRRERLKAMRLEASKEEEEEEEEVSYTNDHSAVRLSNPLLESTTNSQTQPHNTSLSFNYYTNPMAAYSANKQRTQVTPQISHNHPRSQTNETFPPPSLQPHINHSPNPQMQQQGHYAHSNPPQSSNLPNLSWRGNSPHPRGYHGPGVCFPSQQTHFTSGSVQGTYPSPGSSPHFTNSPGRGSGRGYPSPGPNFRNSPNYSSSGPSPHFANSPGHGSGRGYPSPGPYFRNSPNYGGDQGGYPSSGPNQGRGYGLGFGNMSSGPSSGRGRGRGSGQGGGQGRGHNHVSAEDRPDRFYNKSMVEDPWKFLEPVIWKSLKKQWFPPSLNAKKPRVSESPKQSSLQPSLAEILAASFNEAADDEPNAE